MAATLLPVVQKSYHAVVNVMQIIIHNQQPVTEFPHIVWEQDCVMLHSYFCNINDLSFSEIALSFNEELVVK